MRSDHSARQIYTQSAVVSCAADLRAAGLYMLVSILLIVFNKAALSYYAFGAPNVLTLAQNVCSLVFLIGCRRLQLIDFHNFSPRNLRKMVPVGLTFILYMVFGMIAIKVVNVSVIHWTRRGRSARRRHSSLIPVHLYVVCCRPVRCTRLSVVRPLCS
jgi:hypothetical protein